MASSHLHDDITSCLGPHEVTRNNNDPHSNAPAPANHPLPLSPLKIASSYNALQLKLNITPYLTLYIIVSKRVSHMLCV